MNVKNPMTWLNEQISTTLLPILSIYYSIPHTGLKCLQISLIFDFVLLINLQTGKKVKM